MKTVFFTVFSLFIISFATAQRGTGIAVQIVAVDSPLSLSKFAGIPGVYQSIDHNNIYRYYVSGYATSSDAQPMLQKAPVFGARLKRAMWHLVH